MTGRKRLTHGDIVIGRIYYHHMDRTVWQVRVTGVFEDRYRWGWEGFLSGPQPAGLAENDACWGWVDELTD